MATSTAVPLKENITIFQGATFSKRFTLTDDSGTAVDLTDSYSIIEFRDAEGESGTILLSLSSDDGAFTHNGVGGVLTMVLHDENAYSLMHTYTGSKCFYAVKVMYANGEVDCITYGRAILQRLAAPNAYP